jgi:hypothetical protein
VELTSKARSTPALLLQRGNCAAEYFAKKCGCDKAVTAALIDVRRNAHERDVRLLPRAHVLNRHEVQVGEVLAK